MAQDDRKFNRAFTRVMDPTFKRKPDSDLTLEKKNSGKTCPITLNLKNRHLTLVMMGGLQTLVMMRGGSKCPPPFLFVKTIEKVIRLCTVLKKKLFDWQF